MPKKTPQQGTHFFPTKWKVSKRSINDDLTSSTVEYTDSPIPAVVDLVVLEVGVAVRLDPHTSHRVIKYLVIL